VSEQIPRREDKSHRLSVALVLISALVGFIPEKTSASHRYRRPGDPRAVGAIITGDEAERTSRYRPGDPRAVGAIEDGRYYGYGYGYGYRSGRYQLSPESYQEFTISTTGDPIKDSLIEDRIYFRDKILQVLKKGGICRIPRDVAVSFLGEENIAKAGETDDFKRYTADGYEVGDENNSDANEEVVVLGRDERFNKQKLADALKVRELEIPLSEKDFKEIKKRVDGKWRKRLVKQVIARAKYMINQIVLGGSVE